MGYDYNNIEGGYYDKVYRRGSGIQSKWQRLKFDRMKAEMGRYAHHLDIGCGPGTFIGSLDEAGKSVGVDVSARQIEYAEETYGTPEKIFQVIEPGARLPFDDGFFCVVTIIELIEHMTWEDALGLLKEAARALEPGGRLLLSTPNYDAFWPALEFILNRVSTVSYEEQHITKYNRESLKKILTEGGFTVKNVGAYLFAAPFLALLGWGAADAADRIEPRAVTERLGHLLLATAVKA